jgi:hypothetical protein
MQSKYSRALGGHVAIEQRVITVGDADLLCNRNCRATQVTNPTVCGPSSAQSAQTYLHRLPYFTFLRAVVICAYPWNLRAHCFVHCQGMSLQIYSRLVAAFPASYAVRSFATGGVSAGTASGDKSSGGGSGFARTEAGLNELYMRAVEPKPVVVYVCGRRGRGGIVAAVATAPLLTAARSSGSIDRTSTCVHCTALLTSWCQFFVIC